MGKFNKTYLNTDSLHGTNESEIVAFISGGKRYSVNTIKDDIIKLEREDAVFQADECQCTNEQHRGMSTIQNVVFEVQANKIVQKYAVEVGFCPECNAFYIPKESRKYLSDRGKIIHPIRGAHDLFEYKTSGEAFEEERAVLKNLQKTIHRKLDRERPEGNLYETGDYDEIAQMNKSALIAFYKHENEMERFLSCPYSGRLDVGKGNAHKTYYIGGALDEDEVIEGFSVYSSWSKIGRLFYDSSEPSASEIGDSKVLLRRKIHIARGDLKGIEDIFYANTEYAEKGIYDKFLIQVLMTRKKNHQLTDIIATIQKKQRDIIECALVANIIVQGCAGSGKTMVLLHRLSYWLYNNKTLNPEKIKILTPNDNFNKHIRALHSSLNLGGIGILSIEQYYNELLKKYDTRIALQRGREIADESNVKDNAERLVNYIYEKGFQKKLDKIYPEVIYQWVTYDEIDRVSRISRALRMSFSFYPDTKCDADRTDDFGMQIKRLLESPGLNRLKKTDQEFLESMKKRYVDDAPINIFNQVFDETIKDKLEELSIEKPNHIYRYELYARLLFAEKYWNRTVGEEKIICIDEGQDASYVIMPPEDVYREKSFEGASMKDYYANMGKKIAFLSEEFYRSHGIDTKNLINLGIHVTPVIDGVTERNGIVAIGDFRPFMEIQFLERNLEYIENNPDSEISKRKSAAVFKIAVESAYKMAGKVFNRGAQQEGICTPLQLLRNKAWLYSGGDLVYLENISKKDLDKEVYPDALHYSDQCRILGFTADAQEHAYDAIFGLNNKDKRKILEELAKDLGIDLPKGRDQQGNVFTIGDMDVSEFPRRTVGNMNRIQRYVENQFFSADPVRYKEVIVRQRQNPVTIRRKTYVADMYTNRFDRVICQCCRNVIGRNQIFAVEIANFGVEMEQLGLCLCPNCYHKYESIKKTRSEEFKASIKRQVENINTSDNSEYYTVFANADTNVYLTQAHVLEMQTILGLIDKYGLPSPVTKIDEGLANVNVTGGMLDEVTVRDGDYIEYECLDDKKIKTVEIDVDKYSLHKAMEGRTIGVTFEHNGKRYRILNKK